MRKGKELSESNDKGGTTMMRKHNRGLCFATVVAAIFWITGTSGFSADRPFYQGKTLTVLINYAAGGPTDIEGRVLARHLGNHIAGHPRVVVKNMGGAGGIVGTNYLGQVSKPNGLTMGFFTGSVFRYQIRDPGLQVDLKKFGFVAAIEGNSVSYIRSDVPPGIKKPEDLLKAKRFKAGGLQIDSSKDVRMRLSLDLLKVNYDYVTGYSSNSKARAAVQRNEIQFFVESLPAYRAVVQPSMVRPGIVTPLYYTDSVTPDGDVETSPDIPELLSFTQFYKKVYGKAPSGIKYEALKLVNISSGNMLRQLLVPPGTPQEAITALRKGITGLMEDPGYIADAKKTMKFVPATSVGEKGEKLFRKVVEAPPELIDFIVKYTGRGK